MVSQVLVELVILLVHVVNAMNTPYLPVALVTPYDGIHICMYGMLYETLHTCGYLRTTSGIPTCVPNTIQSTHSPVTRSG